uniref:Uncharacterized protein n=1 Tax=Arundo donax TaxID=35708 RepID=A0A0A9CZL7_ARUDO
MYPLNDPNSFATCNAPICSVLCTHQSVQNFKQVLFSSSVS